MAWYDRDGTRLVIEDRSLKASFPSFRFYKSRTTLFVAGKLKTSYGKSYKIKIVYPDNYPHSCPKVYCDIALVPNSPHVFKDGSLCIQYNDWRTSHTIAVVIGWTAHWLHSYEVWMRTGRWPGKEAWHV